MATFKPFIKRQSVAQKFDLDRTIKKAGKDYNYYQVIQAGRQDTELYPTLELYGCIDKMQIDPNKVYADFREFKDLRSMQEQMNKAQQMWNDLPYDVRMKFNNNMHTFVKDGEKYIEELCKQQTAAPDLTQATAAQVNETTKE